MTAAKKRSRIHLSAVALPAVIFAVAAGLLHNSAQRNERSFFMAEQARLAAAAVDLRLERLLNLTKFCASSPAIISRMDPAIFRESCGRYAEILGAWVVVVALGDTHQQVINTRPDTPSVLPSYPRKDEHATLLDIEARSKASGQPEIANVFTGKIYTGGIVSAGQWLRLSDGREAMLYVSVPADALSEQLGGLARGSDTVFALVDPSKRIIARSSGIEWLMFSPAPSWFKDELEAELPGADLGMPGPEGIGGTWDAGFHPLSISPGWMSVAVQPALQGYSSWRFFSLENVLVFLGFAISAALLGLNSYRNRTSEQIAASSKAQLEAEQRSQEKSRLLATFAHDVRSPIVSMIGSLALMEENKSTDPEDIRTARGSAEALLQLVDDILELSFLGSGKFELHPSPVALRPLVNDLAAQARIGARSKGITVEVTVDEMVPPTVEVDRLRLQQVLGNLLTNAIKYTEKGSVTLHVLSNQERNGIFDLSFVVADTGVGIAEEDKSQIFREFGRLDRPIEHRETGTGLGLAICKRILGAMGSDLSLDSAVGKGSVFSFRLSLQAFQGAALSIDAKPLSGVTILYAEDEKIIRTVTSRQLADAGATVIEAEDGVDALAKLQNLSPDLFLVDLQMPRMDGVETIRRIEQLSRKRCYPIFVLTSHISGAKAAEARAVGAEEVFTKPVQTLPLVAALNARRGDWGRHTPNIGGNKDENENEFIEQERVRHLVTTSRTAFLEDYLPNFETRMRDDLALLAQHIENGDLPAARSLAHRCLEICQVLGAHGLGKQLRALEDAAEARDIVQVAALEVTLHDLFAKTAVAMRHFAETETD